MPQVAIVAGEASGDASGAALAVELQRECPDIELWGAGGPRMRSAGVHLLADLSSCGTIGVIESLKAVPMLLGKFGRLKREILTRRPDVFVPIDYGAFNLRLARRARSAGVKVAYYFPPASWRRRLRDPSMLRQAADVVITPFPWSEKILQNAGVDARFVGHPLLDSVRPERTREQFRADSSETLAVGILPGSRQHEYRYTLPVALGACARISERTGQVAVHVGAAPGTGAAVSRIALQECKRLRLERPTVEEGAAYDVMAHSDLLIVCSGTATLEAAILGTPMIIIYNGPWLMKLEYLFRREILDGGFAGMPNIVAEEEVCPELLGEHSTAEGIADIAMELLEDPTKAQEMKSGLARVRSLLGEPGGAARAARVVLEAGGLP